MKRDKKGLLYLTLQKIIMRQILIICSIFLISPTTYHASQNDTNSIVNQLKYPLYVIILYHHVVIRS